MLKHNRRILAGITAAAAIMATALVATPAQATSGNLFKNAANAPDGTAALGLFNKNLTGVSLFTEQGSSINVRGTYAGLARRSSFFTVIYSGNVCDPAGAFPIGPFTTDKHGRGSINQTAANPNGIDVAKTQSISVRRGDDNTDQDGDGKTGPTDVVAVAGQPSIGLVKCDQTPFTN